MSRHGASIALAITIGIALWAGEASAQTLTVCPGGCDYATLTAAVAGAPPGATLALAAGTFTEANITLTKDVTIQGDSTATTILQPRASGGPTSGAARIFTINMPVTVVIQDLTMRFGGMPSGSSGGAIGNVGTLTLRRVLAHDNFAGSNGGFVTTGGALTIEDSTFRDNDSTFHGGTIHLNINTPLTVTDSVFERSLAMGNGGTIFSTGSVGNVGLISLTRTQIIDSSGSQGGALYTNGPLVMDQCLVTNTDSASDAILAGGVEMTDSIIEETFRAGVALRLGIDGSTIVRSIIRGNGEGGINCSGDLTIEDSSIVGNTGNAGAGIMFGTQSGDLVPKLVMRNSTVANNVSRLENNGGGLYVQYVASALLDHVTIAGNQAGGRGGGIYASSVSVTMKNTLVADNVSGLGSDDCYATLRSFGFNLIESISGCARDNDVDNVYGVDPRLGPLGDHGGPTPTRVPFDGSAAIDQGSCTDPDGELVSLDQRGVARPIGATCDIGAVESAGASSDQRFACWDLDEDDVCDLAQEDQNGNGDCEPNDCQGQDGLPCWDLNGNGACDAGSEDASGDGACTLLDCRGADGSNGFSCWDLNLNHACNAAEDLNMDLACNVLDCRGVDGLPGTDGFDCWDLDADYVCDPGGEDLTGDLQCTLLDCRGAAGSDGAACWDLNTNQICDAPEDANGDLLCNVLDCRGTDGFDCWDQDADYVCDPAEDLNEDLDCTQADCQGPAGVACWDLDADGECTPAVEDFTSDAACTVLDCRGDNDVIGLSCWDANINRVCDLSEDYNGDLSCNVVDCRGVPGPAGPAGEDGSDGADGTDGADGANGEDGDEGAGGPAGLDALVRVRQEPPGAACAEGGLAIDTGLDRDRDGALADDEVDDTTYVCDVAGGGGSSSVGEALVEIEDQLPGEQCASGGKRIDSGVDLDGDGSLDDGEIEDTDYVCNGAVGATGKKGCACAIPGAGGGARAGLAPWLAALALLAVALRRRRRAR